MKGAGALLLLALNSVSSFERINRLLDGIEDEDVQRRLLAAPMHMKMKAEYHLASVSAGTFTQAYSDDDDPKKNNSLKGRSMVCNDETGKVGDEYDCLSMDVATRLHNLELGSASEELIGFTYNNDLWGWTDPKTGKEYALVGMFDGTSIVDITDPEEPVVLGFIETSGDLPPNDFLGFWRDIKVIDNVAYIGSEVAAHGLQVFDLTKLRKLGRGKGKGNSRKQRMLQKGKGEKKKTGKEKSGKDEKEAKEKSGKGKSGKGTLDLIPLGKQVLRLEADTVITTIGSSHNIVQFPELKKVLAVGIRDDSTGCDISAGEGVAVFDLSDPLNPVLETCLSGDYNVCDPERDICTYNGYVHCGQCLIYHGPDKTYTGIPICIFFAETEVVLFNMETASVINKFTWPDKAYVHQGWFSEDHTTVFGNDELDELFDTTKNGQLPRTRIIDMTVLDDPDPPITFFDNTHVHPSIDHNLYVKGDYIYSANYEAGSRIYKILPNRILEEVAYVDITNVCADINNCADPYGGSWTHYPYFESGVTIGGDGFVGLFVFQPRFA